MPQAAAKDEDKPDDDEGGQRDEGASAANTRSWFPETFLFAPAVITDARGHATIDLTVPDRLTSWRVLALAHDRGGHQAGATTTFQGTLPVYVQPVLPAFLVVGDRVRLPIQVVNTTATAWTGPVRVALTGCATATFSDRLTVPAKASRVVAVPISSPRSGNLTVSVTMGDTDAVVRTVPVRSVGKLVEQSRGGTLASPRSIELEGPADMDPDSARLHLVVSPGALSVLRREMVRAGASGGELADNAYALHLAGSAPALLSALGEPLDDDGRKSLRTLAIKVSQRVIRDSLAPNTADAALLLPAAASHPDNPVLARLATRLADQLANDQRPDGTFGGGNGQTVQRMLLSTAQAVAAVASLSQTPADTQRATRVRLAASAAFERHQAQVRDPYTASALLASGATSDALARTLRATVRDAITQRADGSRVLPVPADVVRADGSPPSLLETTALAALALLDDPDSVDILPDLGATLLGAWRPGRGWGDGRADLLCMRAIATLLSDPLPDEITVILERDGQRLRQGSLTGARRTELLVLDAPGESARGLHTWTVRAEPPVAGLGFSLALQSTVPWPEPAANLGVQTQIELPADPRVGHRGTLTLSTAAPAHTALTLDQPLPAGVQVDEDSLQALVDSGRIGSFDTSDGLVSLTIPPQDGTTWTATVDVLPTLAGELHTDATRVTLSDRPELVFATPTAPWQVR